MKEQLKMLLVADLEEAETQLVLEETNKYNIDLEIINTVSLIYDTRFGVSMRGKVLSLHYDVLIIMSDKRLAILSQLSKEFYAQKKKVLGFDPYSGTNYQDNLSDFFDLAQAHLPIPHLYISSIESSQDNSMNNQPLSLINTLDLLNFTFLDNGMNNWHESLSIKHLIISFFCHNEVCPYFLKLKLNTEKEQLGSSSYICDTITEENLSNSQQIFSLTQKASKVLGRPQCSVIFGKNNNDYLILAVNKKPIVIFNENNLDILAWYINKWDNLVR